MKDRILALAALLQAVEQVNLMANQGQAQTEPLAACINSLFVFDAGGAVTGFTVGGAGNEEFQGLLDLGGRWLAVDRQRMDAVIVVTDGRAEYRKLRAVRRGDRIVCGPITK